MDDMTKLAKLPPRALPKGMLVVGFSKPDEDRVQMPLHKAYQELSDKIVKAYPYEQVGVQPVDLHDLDDRTKYAMVGLWVCKPPDHGSVHQPAHPEPVEGNERA